MPKLEVKHRGLYLKVEEAEELASEVHWNEFADAFGCVAQHVLLHLHRVKLSFRAVVLIV